MPETETRIEYRVWVNGSWVSTADSPQAARYHAEDAVTFWDGEGDLTINIYPTEVHEEEE